VQLLAVRKAKATNGDAMVLHASDHSILPLQAFAPPPSRLVAWYRCVETGLLKTFTVKDYIFNSDTGAMFHLSYAIVLYGAPKLAKTPFAKSVALAVATLHQSDSGAEPCAIIINTAESLPRSGDSRVKAGVPVIFDDLRPGQTRGGRAAHTVEDLKVMGDIMGGGEMSARFSDIHFEPQMARLFTSNDMSPNDFHPAFPVNLETMTPVQVMGLDNHVKALLKRFAFCAVHSNLIPLATRNAFEHSRRASLATAATNIFSGSNAIP
jgi:hypothetical protein